jgi:hypothetical protein
MEETNRFVNAFVKQVMIPKQEREMFRESYTNLYRDIVARSGMLYYQFDKDLTKAKVIKKLVRKNLDKLKHDNWSMLNLTDNLYHEHEGETYYSKPILLFRSS